MKKPTFKGDAQSYLFEFQQYKLWVESQKLRKDFTKYKKKQKRCKEWKKIRDNIIKRDGCCVECKTNTYLEVHHIDKNRDNNRADNLVTLCYACHTDKHKGERVERLRKSSKQNINRQSRRK